MSVLQQQAQPILGQAIAGQGFALTPVQQATVANWATMTAIMAEYAHRQRVEEYRREFLYRKQSPPPHTFVSLLQVETPLTYGFCGVRSQVKDDPETVHNYISFLSIHQMGMLVVQGSLAPWQAKIIHGHGQFFTQVWPILLKPRRWPPSKPLSPNYAVHLVYELLGSQAPHPQSATTHQVETLAREMDTEPTVEGES